MVWWSLNNHFLLFLQLWSQNPGPSCAGHDLSFPEWQVPDPSAYPSNWARSCQDCWCSSLQVGSNLSVPPSPRAQVRFYYPILKIRQFLAPCCSPEKPASRCSIQGPLQSDLRDIPPSLQCPPWGALGTKTHCHSFMCNRWFHLFIFLMQYPPCIHTRNPLSSSTPPLFLPSNPYQFSEDHFLRKTLHDLLSFLVQTSWPFSNLP